MILTQCAVCATELGLTLGKKCGRCSTRYCGPECQVQHWKDGGHDQLCKKIKKAGGAEQYNANQNYSEAVTVAAEACADDTKGQTCYICTQALHWKTKEGLVRGCSCRGTAGFAHVSCLAEQAKILLAEAEENNLGPDACQARWERWSTCSLCEQNYHGVVACALGWACWKTYVGRPETDVARTGAMHQLGIGLHEAGRHEDALSVREAELAMLRRLDVREDSILAAQGNLANTYDKLGRVEEALNLYHDVYSGELIFYGAAHEQTIISASNYADSLIGLQRFKEAKALFRKTIPVARRVLGESDITTLRMRSTYAGALSVDPAATLDDLREAVTTLEDTDRTARQVLGGTHPTTVKVGRSLREARAALRAREESDVCEALRKAEV
jgi:tetratricopeptide (TPR) repeat protein